MNVYDDAIVYELPCSNKDKLTGTLDTGTGEFHAKGICIQCLSPEGCEQSLKGQILNQYGEDFPLIIHGILGENATKN